MPDNHLTRITLLLLLTIAGRAAGEPIVLRGATMGTTYHIKVVAPQHKVDVKELHAGVEKILADVDLQMSTYRPDSELMRFNRAPANEWVAVSPAVVDVVAAAQEVSEKSDGAMDITVGPLVRLWHFGAAKKGEKVKFKPPDKKSLAEARERVGYQKLEYRREPPALRKLVDGLEVDLSSIASGHAIDRIAAMLSKHAIDNFMVEIGGEVRAAGNRDDGRVWRVAVERPQAAGREMHTAVPLLDAAIATAGDYRKFFEFEGQRYSHIIDPSTGRPIEHVLASVTVVADTCLAADGWDTPLLVLGPDRGFECAERNGIAALFISHDKNGKDKKTTAWQTRFGD